jgi:hypothetical protein
MEWLFIVAFLASIVSNLWTIGWIKDLQTKIDKNDERYVSFIRNTNYYMTLHTNEYKLGYEHGNKDGFNGVKKDITNLDKIE